MNIVQKKLMNYHHGWFMAIGLIIGLLGVLNQFLTGSKLYSPLNIILIGLGALVLGWGTGRCDQKACMVEETQN